MIYGGAAGAVVAALFGWIHTGPWFGGDTVMQLHRWNGMLIAALGMVAAWIAFRNPQSRGALRLTLFPIAALLIAQGYMGGELAHRSEEQTAELQPLIRHSYAAFSTNKTNHHIDTN